MTAAAVATLIGFSPAKKPDRISVLNVAAIVPSIRPPTLVAKLPPVPRRCSGKTFGKNSLTKLNCATVTSPQQKMPSAKTL